MTAIHVPRPAVVRSTTRPRGYAPWNPNADTRALLTDVRSVLVEYDAYLPLTLRQLFYRLVGAHDYPKTENAYQSLGDKMNRARRAGLVRWTAIRDDRATFTSIFAFDDPGDYLKYVGTDLSAATYRRHPRTGQPLDVLVACEASGMVPMLESAVRGYGARVCSSGGFESVTVKRDLALSAIRRPLVVLHVGDHDPSGVHLFSSLAEDVTAFARAEGASVEFCRVAVLPEHITEYGLPTAPAKTTDRRAFRGETVQAEALPPDVLVRLVREAVESYTDLDILARLREQEEDERQELESRLVVVRDAFLDAMGEDA